jgi:hypothetical protein
MARPADIATIEENRELAVLSTLLDPRTPWLWSIEELARELGGELDADDAVASLHAAGLVHRCNEFVFATRAAARFSRLVGGV